MELHGAGKTRRHDLELSAGRNQRTDPLWFGKRLAAHLPVSWTLAVQKRSGTREAFLLNQDHSTGGAITGRLENPALSTPSLSFAGDLGMLALHLEMKAFLRQPDPSFPQSPRPAPDAWQLARALAAVIQELVQPAASF